MFNERSYNYKKLPDGSLGLEDEEFEYIGNSLMGRYSPPQARDKLIVLQGGASPQELSGDKEAILSWEKSLNRAGFKKTK